MAYTTYPAEASDFSSKATAVSTKLGDTATGLREVEGVFKIDKNEDYLTLKSLAATEKLLNQISSGQTLLATESGMVTNKANELEAEAKAEAEAAERAAKAKEEGASNE